MSNPDKPTAFKHWISPELLSRMGAALREAHPPFDSASLHALAPHLAPLELKDRVKLVAAELQRLLPEPFPRGVGVLLKSLNAGTLKGFDLWPYTEWVQTQGLAPEHFEPAMRALHALTRRFTAEFAVRPFLIRHPERTLRLLAVWAGDSDEHVRRLVSEGSRPRLPWGERIPAFVKDPSPTLPLLDRLKHDSSEYVRRSVANHLNDISKDHPEVTLRVLKRWLREASATERATMIPLVKHAARTLVKAGRPEALALLGVDTRRRAALAPLRLTLSKRRVSVGESLGFRFELRSRSKKPQKLIVDYVIHHAKARGHTTPKVFKLKTLTLAPGQNLPIEKNHRLKPVTVRAYHPGRHRVEIQVNGRILAGEDWMLLGR
ncbi:MAG: DNA alkylation repair protein [Bdellovibrionales bacterium]|nr:DNA alkylation repair protein [Bdellovibrionales bacterium]